MFDYLVSMWISLTLRYLNIKYSNNNNNNNNALDNEKIKNNNNNERESARYNRVKEIEEINGLK